MEKNKETAQGLCIGGKYRHFKGGEYRVLYQGKDSETEEDVVIYQALYGERGIWVRPLAMFLSKKEVDGKLVDRFTLIEGPGERQD